MCLPSSVRSRSGQPCSLCRAVDLRVLRPTRRIHIRRRGRVLHNSPPPASVRSATAPTVTAHGTSGRVRRVESALGLTTVPHGDAPAHFARHPRRDAASPEYRLLASLAPVERNPRTASPRVTPLSAQSLSPLPHHMLNPFKPLQQILTDISRTNLSLSKSRGKTKATRFVGCAVRESLFSEFREFSPFQKCLRDAIRSRENGVRCEIEANATTHNTHED